MIYYVQIPCFITRARPNRTATADRWLVIPVEADSQAKALERVEKALTCAVQEAKTPRERRPDEFEVDDDGYGR